MAGEGPDPPPMARGVKDRRRQQRQAAPGDLCRWRRLEDVKKGRGRRRDWRDARRRHVGAADTRERRRGGGLCGTAPAAAEPFFSY